MKRHLAFILACAMTITLITACGNKTGSSTDQSAASGASSSTSSEIPYTAENPLIWKLNSNQNEEETKNSAQGQAYLHLAEALAERTNGAWQVELYYSSQLGSQTADLINGAQFGTFQLFNLNRSNWSNSN